MWVFHRIKRLFLNCVGWYSGLSCCMKCGDTWNWKKWHHTQYTQSSGCFPLCEECWSSLTIEQRVPYYHALVNEHIQQMLNHVDTPNLIKSLEDYEGDRAHMIAAVMEGR